MNTDPAGLAGGAVYVTVAPDALVVGEIVPQAAPVQFVPETVHIAPKFEGSFTTVATSGNVPLICTEPVVGLIEIEGCKIGRPVDIVIWPTTLQFDVAGQLITI